MAPRNQRTRTGEHEPTPAMLEYREEQAKRRPKQKSISIEKLADRHAPKPRSIKPRIHTEPESRENSHLQYLHFEVNKLLGLYQELQQGYMETLLHHNDTRTIDLARKHLEDLQEPMKELDRLQNTYFNESTLQTPRGDSSRFKNRFWHEMTLETQKDNLIKYKNRFDRFKEQIPPLTTFPEFIPKQDTKGYDRTANVSISPKHIRANYNARNSPNKQTIKYLAKLKPEMIKRLTDSREHLRMLKRTRDLKTDIRSTTLTDEIKKIINNISKVLYGANQGLTIRSIDLKSIIQQISDITKKYEEFATQKPDTPRVNPPGISLDEPDTPRVNPPGISLDEPVVAPLGTKFGGTRKRKK